VNATAASLRSELGTAVTDLKNDIGGVKSELTAAEGRVTLLEQGHTRMAARQDDLADTASTLRRDLDQLADDVAHKVRWMIDARRWG
jgi:outer membrane murein-binding lipoprotein Lpp